MVVGAGRGIGRAIATAYGAAGAAVVCAARTLAEIEAVARQIESEGGRALAVRADVADRPTLEALFEVTAERLGGVDLVVVNAGTLGPTLALEEVPPDEWERIIQVNLIGAYSCMRAAVPHLKARGGGKIISVGSGFGHRGAPGYSAYSASKAGSWMLVRVLAQELRPYAIAVNELVPGPVHTKLGVTPGSVGEESGRAVASGEWWKQPEDVTGLALFLATLPNHGPTAQTFKLVARDN